jgi:hypothetical protein
MKKHQATLRIHPSVDQEAGVASYLIKKTKIVVLSNAHIYPPKDEGSCMYPLLFDYILINLDVKALKHMYAYILKIAEGMKCDRHNNMGMRGTRMWGWRRKTLNYDMPPLRVTSRASKHGDADDKNWPWSGRI